MIILKFRVNALKKKSNFCRGIVLPSKKINKITIYSKIQNYNSREYLYIAFFYALKYILKCRENIKFIAVTSQLLNAA